MKKVVSYNKSYGSTVRRAPPCPPGRLRTDDTEVVNFEGLMKRYTDPMPRAGGTMR